MVVGIDKVVGTVCMPLYGVLGETSEPLAYCAGPEEGGLDAVLA